MMKPVVPPNLGAEVEGVCIASPVFSIRLFTDKPLSELAPAVFEPLRRYRELVGDASLRFYATANMRKHKPVTKRALTMLETWLAPGAKRDYYLFLNFQDAKDYNHAPSTLFIISGREVVRGMRAESATMVRISLPMQWGLEAPERMLALVQEFWGHLPWRSGLAGFALETSRYFTAAAHEHAYGRSMRHPGVDIPDAANDAHMAGFNRVRAAGWLTMLDDAFVEGLGGVAALRELLAPLVDVLEEKRGVILRAGPVPQFGDVNRKDDLPAYRAVHAVVQPLMYDPGRAPSLDIGGDFAARNEAWLTRFGR